MGRRVLAFFLGVLVGIVFVFGAVVAAVYFTAVSLTPSDIYPDSDKFLGDLADMSLYDIYKSVSDLYKQKIGVTDENGLYFTLGQFCEHYNINPNELFGGKEVPQDVLDIPIFEFFGGESSDGAMQQVKMSALFALINMYTTGEDGNGYFSQSALEKLAERNLAQLFDPEKGFPYVFEEIMLVDILPDVFPTEKAFDNTLMWALGRSSVGRIMEGFEGKKILLEFKAGGAFETIGLLTMKEMMGDGSAMLNAIFKEYTFADLIDNEGNLNPDTMMNGVYLGELLGYQRNLLAADAASGYEQLYATENRVLLRKAAEDEEGEDQFILIVPAFEEGAYDLYEARMFCTAPEHTHSDKCDENLEGYTCGYVEHTHSIDCFGFVWYLQSEPTKRATGIYTVVADLTIGDLTSGNSEALIDRFLDVRVYELLEGQNLDGTIGSLKDLTLRELVNGGIDGIYFGVLFEYHRIPVTDTHGFHDVVANGTVKQNEDGVIIRVDAGDWYEAELKCDEEHEHNEKCYPFMWFTDATFQHKGEGIKAALSNTTIGELNDINDTVKNLTLHDVLGSDIPSMLKSLEYTKIRDLNDAINKMYLGDFLEYVRNPVEGIEGNGAPILDKEGKDTVYYLAQTAEHEIALSVDGKAWYEGKLICTDEQHTHNADCYVFVWYECKHKDAEGHAHGSDGCKAVEGMMGKLSNENVAGLNGLTETIMTFTLYDVMGDDVPDMLKSIQDTQIKDLNDAIDKMYLGDFLEYVRKPVEGVDGNVTELKDAAGKVVYYMVSTGDTIALSVDGKVWYEGLLVCTDEKHNHNADCYVFAWYQCQNQSDGHKHGEPSCYETLADGMMGKLANKKISDLSNLNNTIMSFTLYDVMQEKVPNALKSIQHTPISELEGAMQAMYLGEFLEYARITPENIGDYEYFNQDVAVKYATVGNETLYVMYDAKYDAWYEATLDCIEKHTAEEHDEKCFNYVWYNPQNGTDGTTYAVVKGVMGKLASTTLGKMSAGELTDVINKTRLGDVIQDWENNALLSELADVRIRELSTALNALYVGTAMGYFRQEATGNFTAVGASAMIFEDNSGNYYIFDENKGKYFNAQLTCADKTEQHQHVDTCYGFIWYDCSPAGDEDHTHNATCVVKGLNGKMSNLTIEGLSGDALSSIMSSLTIGDLIESNMITLNNEEESSYKFAIICCKEHDNCSLVAYFAAQFPNAVSAKDFWLRAHGIQNENDMTPEQIAHRDEWRNMPLNQFINELLGAF